MASNPETNPLNTALNKKGLLMKLDFAPTSCIVLITKRLEYTANLMVMLINITEINSNIPAITRRINSKFLNTVPTS